MKVQTIKNLITSLLLSCVFLFFFNHSKLELEAFIGWLLCAAGLLGIILVIKEKKLQAQAEKLIILIHEFYPNIVIEKFSFSDFIQGTCCKIYLSNDPNDQLYIETDEQRSKLEQLMIKINKMGIITIVSPSIALAEDQIHYKSSILIFC